MSSLPGQGLMDQAGQGADHAMRQSRRYAADAMDSAGATMHELRDRAKPMLGRVKTQATDLGRRSYDAVRERALHLKDSASRASDNAVLYVKDEPVKSLLIAAAAGAALMAVFSLLSSRQSSRHDSRWR